jgi:hypothetical protein
MFCISLLLLIVVEVPVGSSILFLVIQTSSGAQQASYSMSTVGPFLGVRHKRCEAEVKKMWIYTSTPPFAFIM